MTYNISQVITMTGGKALSLSRPGDCVSTLLTDSRSLAYAAETLFFAIRTPHNDGHHYLSDLYSRGVRNFVIDSKESLPEGIAETSNVILVDDTLSALHRLTACHRSQFDIPMIAITGSHGKTITKEWLYQLLRHRYSIARSPRSFNSQIGVPLSLWEIDSTSTLAIIEAGISKSGEMESLRQLIKPTIGVITGIGNEHSEGFVSMQEKAREKASLLSECHTAIYCADEPLLAHTAPQADKVLWSLSDSTAQLFVKSIATIDGVTEITYTYCGNESRCRAKVGEGMTHSLVSCLAVMLTLGISPEEIAERMEQLEPVDTRINVIEGANHCLVVHDGYTADYGSLAPALDFVCRRRTHDESLTVILSDFLDEAHDSASLYHRIAQLLSEKGVSRVIGIGAEISRHCEAFAQAAQMFATTDEFLAQMKASDFSHELILVKGARDFGFAQIINMLEARRHESVLQVNLDALASNYNFFRSRLKPDTKIACMLKASGYGAGSYELAKTLQDRGCAYIAVAAHDEGAALRAEGITMNIMVLNPCVADYREMFAHRLEPEVFSIDVARRIIADAEQCGISNYPVHIKIDSGMHRLGFTLEQLPELVELLKTHPAIRPASIFSHLAVADEPENDAYTLQQVEYFNRCHEVLQAGFDHKIMRHILNSTGIMRFPEYQYDMVRLGIGLYGLKTLYDGSQDELQPVSSLHSVIISIKEWPAGTTIGYGRRGILDRPARIATIPVGYADGIDRHYGCGNISMWINGTLCPTVGNICMDLCMVDVTEAQCQVGDPVEIFGEHIAVERLAEARGTIHYEVLTGISQRIKRVYYRE